MGGCQNYGPFLGTVNIRCRIIIGIQKGTIILTSTHKASVFRGDIRVQGLSVFLVAILGYDSRTPIL